MATAAAFSRLQLAAALLEYDNDLEDPDAPYRSAQDSAIFAHLRRNPAARPELASRKSDYLGVSIPSESGSVGGRESALNNRRSRGSRGSMDALRNPFGGDNNSEFEEHEEGEEPALEVDLASWGLDAFMPKEKSKNAKGKERQQAPPPVGSTPAHRPSTNHESSIASPKRGLVTSRSASVGGNLDYLGTDASTNVEDRRRSYGTPLDLAGMESLGPPLQRGRATSQASMTPSHIASQGVPFPTASGRSPSPGFEQAYDARPRTHDRTHSMASMNSKLLYEETVEEYPLRERNSSSGTMGPTNNAEDNPFTIHNPSHISRFDSKTVEHARRYSNASMSSRIMLENDNVSVMTRQTRNPHPRERRYSTLELLRPKVLVMPSPLQHVSTNVPVPSMHQFREGFEHSTDGPPLPPGARSSRRLSSSMSVLETAPDAIPLASNSFIPNPNLDLSLSQKTFRNTLIVGGRSGLFTDTDGGLPRATEDGEQIQLNPIVKVEEPLVTPNLEGDSKALRPAGKLFGKSLIDDLESRKAQMRSKQRVFKGDERPSMMAREQSRSSTLIDPASLQARPTTQRLSSYGSSNSKSPQALGRQPSITMKPLLTFEDDGNKTLQPSPVANRVPNSRSVFGVDTLWEREMVKLKEIQAREVVANEEKRKAEEETERKKTEKKNKGKKKAKSNLATEDPKMNPSVEPRVSVEPPTLPVIQRASRRPPPKGSESDATSESEDDDLQPRAHATETPAWHAGSSDDEDAGPRRMTGVGPRYPKPTRKLSVPVDNDSDEDLPLVATIHKAVARAALGGMQTRLQDSDDEDRPLSHVIRQAKTYSSPPRKTFSKLSVPRNDGDDEDDQPLGLRASRIHPNHAKGDEDDLPLAFHPEQQRRTQYQMLAQQQQQQQQMMMQAQLQSNMLMNASMMGQGYFSPMMNPMGMMQMPMRIPSPPPIADEAKIGFVDRWRRDVVPDGEKL
ncbi:hypothetical protein B0H34DRAFT_793756 [Crassisporium funariophilum]|nr:hypothetical protein B0H34DRAFT_793756 [Crassisporium funariophilum]